MNNKCIICRNSNNKIVFKEHKIDILKCQNCGHVFSSYQPDQDYDGYFGNQINKKEQFYWNEAHRKLYSDFCNKFIVNKSGRLLDIGCGLGYFVKKISSFKNWETFGYEVSKAAVEFATTKLKLDNIFCGKVEESNFPKNYFDIVTLWDVIEHIPDPNPLLSYTHSILKDNGIIFIHTPNVQIQLPKAKIKKIINGMNPRVHYLEAKDHINIYSMNSIEKLLYHNGFNDINFIHMHPIQSVSGSRNSFLKFAKNVFFQFSKVLFVITFDKINTDNLFLIAKK